MCGGLGWQLVLQGASHFVSIWYFRFLCFWDLSLGLATCFVFVGDPNICFVLLWLLLVQRGFLVSLWRASVEDSHGLLILSVAHLQALLIVCFHLCTSPNLVSVRHYGFELCGEDLLQHVMFSTSSTCPPFGNNGWRFTAGLKLRYASNSKNKNS